MTSYDTIVVGCGVAGAAAGGELARAGRRVLLLEGQGRVGGRVRTERLPRDDGIVELGAEWIHGTQSNSVFELATRHQVPLRVQDLTFEVYRSDGSRTDDQLMAELIDYCLAVMEEGSDVEETLGHVIERKFRVYIAERHPHLVKDTDFVENFLHLINLLVNNHEASNDWCDVTALSKYTPLGGDQHVSWHRRGYCSLLDILLNKYNNGPGLPSLDIKLNKEVTSIQWSEDGVLVGCRDGAQYSAPNVIVTVSLGVLKERHASLFYPGLPPDKVEAIETISMGVVDKIVVTFDRRWWNEDAEFFGFLWRDADKRALRPDRRWLAGVFGASAPLGARNTLTLWTSGEVAKMVETLPEQEVRTRVVELLQRFVGRDVTVPPPKHVIRSTWYSNTFTRGSYTYDNVLMPRHAGARRALAAPLVAGGGGAVRVLFAGEATHDTHFSTVHGALDSGRREARRLLQPASKM